MRLPAAFNAAKCRVYLQNEAATLNPPVREERRNRETPAPSSNNAQSKKTKTLTEQFPPQELR